MGIFRSAYGNLEIAARLRSDLEIGRSVAAKLQCRLAGPNLQIWAHRVAISRSP